MTDSPNGIYGISTVSHSTLTPANLTTLPHFSVSPAISAAPAATQRGRRSKRSFILCKQAPLSIVVYSWSMAGAQDARGGRQGGQEGPNPIGRMRMCRIILGMSKGKARGWSMHCLERKLAIHGALASAIGSMRPLGASSKEIVATLRFAASKVEQDEAQPAPGGV